MQGGRNGSVLWICTGDDASKAANLKRGGMRSLACLTHFPIMSTGEREGNSTDLGEAVQSRGLGTADTLQN